MTAQRLFLMRSLWFEQMGAWAYFALMKEARIMPAPPGTEGKNRSSGDLEIPNRSYLPAVPKYVPIVVENKIGMVRKHVIKAVSLSNFIREHAFDRVERISGGLGSPGE